MSDHTVNCFLAKKALITKPKMPTNVQAQYVDINVMKDGMKVPRRYRYKQT